jgi:hypothetical protein
MQAGQPPRAEQIQVLVTEYQVLGNKKVNVAKAQKEHYKDNMDFTAGIGAVKASLELGRILSERLNRPDIDAADVRAKIHEMLIQDRKSVV